MITRPTLIKTLFCAVSILVALNGISSHNNGGYIHCSFSSPFVCETTLTTLTRIGGEAPESEVSIDWGDGSSTLIDLDTTIELKNGLLENRYTQSHVFPGPGNYTISFEVPFWKPGIQNLPNSDQVPFFTQTQVVIDLQTPLNATPHLELFEVNQAAVNQPFHLNLSVNENRDQLRYRLLDLPGQTSGYNIPAGASIDSLSGQFTWQSPQIMGCYAFAVQVDECYESQSISSTTIVFTIDVGNAFDSVEQVSETQPWPLISGQFPNYTIAPEDTLLFPLVFSDSTADSVSLEFLGSGMELTTAVFQLDSQSTTSIQGSFVLAGSNVNLRCAPYGLTMRAVSYKNGDAYTQDLSRSVVINDGSLSCSFGCGSSVGIPSVSVHENQVFVFPNPANSLLYLSGLEEGQDFILYDISGSEILSGWIKSEGKIDVSQLQPGMYFLSLSSDFSRSIKVIIE